MFDTGYRYDLSGHLTRLVYRRKNHYAHFGRIGSRLSASEARRHYALRVLENRRKRFPDGYRGERSGTRGTKKRIFRNRALAENRRGGHPVQQLV